MTSEDIRDAIKKLSDLTNEIKEKSKDSFIYSMKTKIVSSILEDILKEISSNILQYPCYFKNIIPSILNELEKLSNIFDFLNDKQKCIKYLINKYTPIDKKIEDINNIMESIKNSLLRIFSNDFVPMFSLPKPEPLRDFEKIDNILANPGLEIEPQIRESKRKEIKEIYRNNRQPFLNLNKPITDQAIFDEINRYPDFKVNINDYDIQGVIFQSGQNIFEYHEGENKQSKKKVIIFILKDKSKFKNAFSVLRTVQNPNFEKFIGCDFVKKNVYFIKERRGEKLSTILHAEKTNGNYSYYSRFLKPGDRSIIAYKIALALYELNSFYLIALRNLSSANIYIEKVTKLNEKGKKVTICQPIIGGLEYAKIVSGKSFDRTNIQLFCESNFIAPESSDFETYNEKIDVFAFSGVLYELLTGNYPIDPKLTKPSAQDVILKGVRPDLSGYPDKITSIIENCWLNDEKKRWSFENVIEAMSPSSKQEPIFPQDENSNLVSEILKETPFKNAHKVESILYKKIQSEINTNFFQSVFGQIHPIISNYQFLLMNSKYSKENENEN